MRWARVREAARGVLFRRREDLETAAEMRFHLKMEAERLVREEGLPPEEARRRAAVSFGGVDRHAEEVRRARGLGWLSGLTLDFRLGARMLVKYPGLTLVGGLGMAVGMALSAGFFAMTKAYILPALPLSEGDRIIAIAVRDAQTGGGEGRILHDLAEWRRTLRTVTELSAFQKVRRNLISEDTDPQVVHVASMTASGFRIARVPPLLGRVLLDEDERTGAPPVVVIGYDVWQSRFGGDPAVLGRSLRLGNTAHTIVGVMPEGFSFPMSFSLWTPLATDLAAYERREGPDIFVFGRLAEGATEEQAQAELAAAGERLAAAWPRTHEHLRPELTPFTSSFSPVGTNGSMAGLYLLQLFMTLLLVVVAVNVAVLVYARTATRQGEIAVRTALGASRARIAGQLFLEALVLAAGAALVGLLIAGLTMRWLYELLREIAVDFGGLPFWIRGGVPAGTLVLLAVLTLFAAAVVGLVPALQATGRGLQSRLRQLGGGTGPNLGRTWTVLIVAQVAFAVAMLPASLFVSWEYMQYGFADPGFPAEEFLSLQVEMDEETPPSAEAEAYHRAFHGRYHDLLAQLAERLAAEPGVVATALTQQVPGQEWDGRLQLEGDADGPVREVSVGRVDDRFFATMGMPTLTGRTFTRADLETGSRAVVVNRLFVDSILGGGEALGRRFRYAADEPGPWYEIVGVVGNVPPKAMFPGQTAARLYHPLVAGLADPSGATPGFRPAGMMVRFRGVDPTAYIPRLRQIMAELDPTMRAQETMALDRLYYSGEKSLMRLGAVAILLIMFSVLLLSAAGIYALMSFTVTRRRREIGIRAALGADPRRILAGIFSRAARQLAIGTVIGAAVAALLFEDLTGQPLFRGVGIAVLAAVAVIMMAVGLLAALGPARRGLGIQPTEALRQE